MNLKMLTLKFNLSGKAKLLAYESLTDFKYPKSMYYIPDYFFGHLG